MNAPISDLQHAIAEVIARNEAAYDVDSICVFFGLEPKMYDDPWDGKHRYVMSRLKTKSLDFLIDVASKVQERYQDEELEVVLRKFTSGGVSGDIKNIIFAANGPKPEIVLTDTMNNNIDIVANAQYCLVYDKPIMSSGLLWNDLVTWWKDKCQCEDDMVERSLYSRLRDSLFYMEGSKRIPNEAERFILYTYHKEFKRLGNKLPALIPQVYLHYDPKTLKELGGKRRIPRERMDFLLLFSDKDRVVLEIDGKQHYAEGDKASPKLYAEMVSEDRRLRLLGYEVYRFGGYEFVDKNVARKTIINFFDRLFRKHGIFLD